MARKSLIALVGALLPAVYAWGESPAPSAPQLPAGSGREIAAAHCVSCHDTSRLVTPCYNPAGWEDVIERMTKLGVVLSAPERPVLTEYLAHNFPPQPQAAARVMGGGTSVSFREWAVATTGAFPHDPLATADGAIWYTGQRASVLGRIDPQSGAIREYPTTVPDSGPHGLTADSAGRIWFTANSAAYIGRLDPASGEITAYRMPDPAARDPHTPVFDQSGMLWFTVQGGNRVGRLDPRSGEVRTCYRRLRPDRAGSRSMHRMSSGTRTTRGYLGRFVPTSGAAREWASPCGARSQPYGIAVLDGIVWYSESGVTPNTLVRFDPQSGAFQTWPIPSGAAWCAR